MFAFVVRRLVQTIPTLAGVILITFLLFHVVGGSPATLALGQHAGPRALEDFDEARGFNKPLFLGREAPTRALADRRAKDPSPPPWPGAARTPDGWRLAPDTAVALPMAFTPDVAQRFRLTLEVRLPPDAEVALFAASGEPAAAGEAWENTGAAGSEESSGGWAISGRLLQQTCGMGVPPMKHGQDARATSGGEAFGAWQTIHWDLTGADLARPPALAVRGGALEVRRLTLRRLTASLFDSQLRFYLGQLLRFDLGYSLSENQRVSVILRQGIGPSMMLTVPIFLGGLLAAVSVALFCAWFRDTWLDRGFVLISVALMSVNYIVWIVLGQYLLAFKLGWFPVWGFESWRYLLLPVLIGIVSGLGTDVRFYRTIMLDEMYREYVRTARAKGLSRTRILFRHVLRNAMIPVLTQVVLALPFLYTGSLLLENFFGIPGLGYLGVNAIYNADADVLRAVVLVGALLYMAANLLTDLAYAWLDPRVKLG